MMEIPDDLRANASRSLATSVLAVDLGGTKIVASVVAGGKILSCVKVKTDVEAGPAGVVRQIAACCGQALAARGLKLSDVAGAGVAVPGLVESATGTVIDAPNLGWKSFGALARLKAAIGCPVVLANDVNAGLVGEWAFGAVKAFQRDPLAGIFVGTGVGGALMLDGRLVTGASGIGGELGHMKVLAGGPRCACGGRGCLEALASRSAIERALGKKRGGLTSGRIRKGLEKKGRKKLKKAVADACYYLGVGVANILNIFNPRALVLGGGFMEAMGARLMPAILGSAREHAFKRSFEDCRIVLSSLGDSAVPLGVACLAGAALDQSQ